MLARPFPGLQLLKANFWWKKYSVSASQFHFMSFLVFLDVLAPFKPWWNLPISSITNGATRWLDLAFNLAIYNYETGPKSKNFAAEESSIFCQIQNKPTKNCFFFLIFAKVAKFRQNWSHWLHTVIFKSFLTSTLEMTII